MSGPPIARVILYVKDIQTVAAFYVRFFNMTPLPGSTEGWLELASFRVVARLRCTKPPNHKKAEPR